MKQRKQIVELAVKNGYQIKGLKIFKGMDDHGFNCNLLRYGKKIAEVVNDGSGGPTLFHWLDKAEEPKLQALCNKVEPADYDGIMLNCDMDIFIGEMIDHLQEENAWKSRCQNFTIVLLKSLEDSQYIQYKAPYSPELAEKIREKYGDDLEEIVNERYLKPVNVKAG